MLRWFEIVTYGPSHLTSSPDNERLLWLEKVFVQYLLDWKVSNEYKKLKLNSYF